MSAQPHTWRDHLIDLVNERGEIGLYRLIEEFYVKASQDILIGFFFNEKDLPLIAQKQADFVLKQLGFRSSYHGKAPAAAHDSIAPILDGHFDRRARLIEEVLKKNHVKPEIIAAWIEFEGLYRAAVVRPEVSRP